MCPRTLALTRRDPGLLLSNHRTAPVASALGMHALSR